MSLESLTAAIGSLTEDMIDALVAAEDVSERITQFAWQHLLFLLPWQECFGRLGRRS